MILRSLASAIEPALISYSSSVLHICIRHRWAEANKTHYRYSVRVWSTYLFMVVMLIFSKETLFPSPKMLFISYAMWYSTSWRIRIRRRRNRQPGYQNKLKRIHCFVNFQNMEISSRTHMCVKLDFVGIFSFFFVRFFSPLICFFRSTPCSL